MPKAKTVFVCSNCGNNSPKWMGKCPVCGEWNTYIEEVVVQDKEKPFNWKDKGNDRKKSVRPKRIAEIETGKMQRLVTPDQEFNRVLGGGIVPGSLILIGGEPGIGKSTLALQVALKFGNLKILYVTGEESEEQIKMRAGRVGENNPECYILAETNMVQLFEQASRLDPGLVIIDSIQTMYSTQLEATPGSISQIRECTGELQRFAKETGTPVILIGHITKEGVIAGPKLLEHMVDTVLQFEGDPNYNYRILRTIKNRFGSTAELGIYEMQGNGLREVSNPSELLISSREAPVPGIAIGATVEGIRPMLIEVQALVTQAVYGTPQRSSTGFDLRRLHMLLAVLEKQSGFKFGVKDVFLNIAGGIRVSDPGIDLAIISALLSSFEDAPLPLNAAFAGEVGLSGEVRPVNRLEQRVAEADRLGFESVSIPKNQLSTLNPKNYQLRIVPVDRVESLYKTFF